MDGVLDVDFGFGAGAGDEGDGEVDGEFAGGGGDGDDPGAGTDDVGRAAVGDGLPPRLFATTGPARLVLITCGGPFDSAARSYLDNIVVYATPTTSN